MTDYSIKVRRYEHVTDPRLKRHVVHDSRSLAYQVRARDVSTLRSVRHHINIPLLDQGQLGSCTGNAGTNGLASDPNWPQGSKVLSTTDTARNEAYAVGLYSDATKLDPWPGQYPPQDTGSDGLSVAKAMKARGLISGYQHATSRDAAFTALQDGPVLMGSDWFQDTFTPDADGRLHFTGGLAGGHEYLLDELDVENQRVWMLNSWADWGLAGRAWMTWADFTTQLAHDGDITVLVPLTQPAPTPTPPQPTPSGVDATLAAALTRYLQTKHCPEYVRDAATAWLAGQ